MFYKTYMSFVQIRLALIFTIVLKKKRHFLRHPVENEMGLYN
jgi:hypothetical protein